MHTLVPLNFEMHNLNDFFTWAEGQQNLEHTRPSKSRMSLLLRVERMRAMCTLLDNPHLAYKVVHIAGSKGKGSTAHLIANALEVHGYRVGCYLSPHVYNYRERILLFATYLSDSCTLHIAHYLRDTLQKHFGDRVHPRDHEVLSILPPTTFEILTLFAFLIFRAAQCQWAVVECGLGGKYDSTNVVSPILTIITTIEREHTQYLGKRLRQIATQKAGIIKPSAPLFLTRQKKMVAKNIIDIAKYNTAPVYYVPDYIEEIAHTDGVYRISLRNINEVSQKEVFCVDYPKHIFLPCHIMNIITAYLATSYCVSPFLPERFHSIIPRSQLIARYEKICDTPIIYCDGAHTRISLASVVDSFTTHFGTQGLCVFGCSADKDMRRLLRTIRVCFSRYIFTNCSYSNKHAMISPNALLHHAEKIRLARDPNMLAMSTEVDTIMQSIHAYNIPTLICGSFYIIAPLRDAIVSYSTRTCRQ